MISCGSSENSDIFKINWLSSNGLFIRQKRLFCYSLSQLCTMAIRVAINHKTIYHYDRFVSLSPHIFRLRPAVHSRTHIEAYSFKVTPKDHFINWQQDPFGNYQARVVFPEKTKELSIEVEVIANMMVINPFDFFVEEYAENYPFQYTEQLKEN